MGMFDKPKYLTGEEGYVGPGDTFYLHNARIDGTANVRGKERPQAKLAVSRDGNPASAEVVFTSGAGIVGQIQRMDREDVAALPMEVRLDQVPSREGNPTNVLTPANLPPASAAVTGEVAADF